MINWGELLQNLLYGVVITVIPTITGFLINALCKWVSSLKAKTNNELVNSLISVAEDVVVTTVEAASQTYVSNLKKEGKFTVESQKEIFEKTKDAILNNLSNEMKEAVEAVYQVDIKEWVQSKIESTIAKSK